MILLRKMIFVIFVAIYLIVAPLTVLYALGYLFNPVQQTLYQTGLISLSSEPPRATVWVNGSLVEDKTPLILRNLKPGTYDVRIEFPGRQPWHKRVEVKPERVLRFENILLFPNSFESEVLSDFPVSKMWRALGGKYLLVLEGNQAAGLRLFETEEKSFLPVFVRPHDRDAKLKEVYPHPAGDRAIVVLQREGTAQPVLIKFDDPSFVTNLSDYLSEPFLELKWSLNRKDSIFFLKDDTLVRLDLDRGELYPALGKRVLGYAPRDRHLFVLDRELRFLELSEKGRIQNVLFEDISRARLIFGKDLGGHYSISFLPNPSVFSTLMDSIALFLSENGRLLSNKLPYFLDEDVDEVAVGVSHPRAVYRKGKELWVVDFENVQEKSFFESGPAPRRIYKGKETLGNLLWFYEDQYVLFSEGNQLMVQDFEGRGEAIKLLKTSDRTKEIVLDTRRGFLYFVHPKTDRLCRVKLFEETGLLPRLVDNLVKVTKESK